MKQPIYTSTNVLTEDPVSQQHRSPKFEVLTEWQSFMPTSEGILENKPAGYYRFLAECIKVAEHRGTISYEAIGDVISQPAINTRHWAAAVSRGASEAGHPMLSAVIVRKNDHTPGDGFYQLASSLGHLEQDPESMSEDKKINFWEDQLEEVYETFSK